jgi:hypothetical protein
MDILRNACCKHAILTLESSETHPACQHRQYSDLSGFEDIISAVCPGLTPVNETVARESGLMLGPGIA